MVKLRCPENWGRRAVEGKNGAFGYVDLLPYGGN